MNEYLMSFYDEYASTGTIEKLTCFTYKTFPKDGTDKLFIGCTLILITNVYRTRTTAEALKNIVESIKESVGKSNLLEFYLDRVNTKKIISKYLCKELKNKDVLKHADLILDWIDNFYFDFSYTIKRSYEDKLKKYNKSK